MSPFLVVRLGRSWLDVEDLTRIEGAIAEAEEVARMLGTDGARSQVRYLEDQRQQLLDQIATREPWIESQADLLHTYATIKDELQARTAALVVSYQLRPPQDVLEALGPRLTNTVAATRWDAAARRHAEARIRLGPDVDLADPAVLEGASWRTAIDGYVLQPDLERGPVMRLAG